MDSRGLAQPSATSATAMIGIACLAMLVYANATLNGFVLDDRAILLDHPVVRGDVPVWHAFVAPYWPEHIGGGQYRPLGLLSFALDHALSGPSALWSHVVNVAWHAAATVLLWRYAARYLAPAGALFAAALFAVHPVHVEAVANVVGRLELMAATLVLAALLAHARRSWVAVPLYLAACLSKEHAIVFLPLALASHVALDAEPATAIRERRALWLAYAIVTAGWLAAMLYATRNDPPMVSAIFSGLDSGPRLLTVLSIVPEYLRLLLLPIHLSADYEPAVLTAATSFDSRVVLGAVVLMVWGWATWRAWRADRFLAYAMLFVPVALAPVSNVLFPTGIALAERALYLPSVGVCLAAGWLVANTRPQRKTAILALGGTAIVLGAVRTWTRTPVWRDSRTYALTLLEDHPESYRGHWVAGRVLLAAGDVDAARREYTLAVRIYGDNPVLNREANELGVTVGTRPR